MLQALVVHFAPEALEPVIHDWCGGEVYILDAETEGVIGRGRIVVERGDRITVKPAPDFPQDFFPGDLGKMASLVGVRYNKLDGLPPIELSEDEAAAYRNTKVVSVDYFNMKEKAAKKRKELMGAILERFECGKDYTMVDFLPAMAAVGFSSLTISGSIASKAIGELLAQGFLTFTYDASEDNLVFRRL